MGRSFRVVLDTNIVVSGVLAAGGLEARTLEAALHGGILLYASAPILEEYENVLARPKFRLSGPVRSGLIAALKSGPEERRDRRRSYPAPAGVFGHGR